VGTTTAEAFRGFMDAEPNMLATNCFALLVTAGTLQRVLIKVVHPHDTTHARARDNPAHNIVQARC